MQASIERAHRQFLSATRGVRRDVTRLVITAAIARQLDAVLLACGQQRPRLLQRHGETDQLIAHLRADLERRRQRLVLRHREWRAIGKHAARAAQAELADGEQIALDLHFGEAPGIRAQPGDAPFQVSLQIAFLLLEMLRA